MTTLAYKAGVLAFDSRVTAGDTVYGGAVKGRKTNKYLMAVAGDWQDAEAFMDWVEDGAVWDDRKKYGLADREVEISAIVVNKKGQVLLYGSRLYPMIIDALFYAEGSGAPFALGAMSAGATAAQAVKIAAKFDTGTGGTVRELKW